MENHFKNYQAKTLISIDLKKEEIANILFLAQQIGLLPNSEKFSHFNTEELKRGVSYNTSILLLYNDKQNDPGKIYFLFEGTQIEKPWRDLSEKYEGICVSKC